MDERLEIFVISKPDVFKSPNLDISIGEAEIDDLRSQLETQAAEQFKAPNLSNLIPKAEPLVIVQDDKDDESSVESKDIELVMTQAGVTRPKTIKVLKAADWDNISAVMELAN
ncbi:nascent polypeptide-associated complex subunit alpha-like protein 1 [Apium graveolens]|uniref:nascent polypeptide-associated complex subunit alpha-like protein 1 n=1 Tax=Apium graveolens TaxID=4045 RepID=UPI003D7AF747